MRESKQRAKDKENRKWRGKGWYLDSNLCSLLLGSAHQAALLGVEGRHGQGGRGQPMAAGLQQLLSNLLSHLCLLAGRGIHLVKLQQTRQCWVRGEISRY